MTKKLFFIFFLPLILIYSDEKQEIEQKATETLDKALTHAGLATVEFAVGGLKISHGDAISASIYIGHGIIDLKHSIEEFKEAKDLYERAREYGHE